MCKFCSAKTAECVDQKVCGEGQVLIKKCFFCDKKRTCIIIISDKELPVCGNCEHELKQKLKSEPTLIPYVPYEPCNPIIPCYPIWQIDLTPNFTCGALDVTYHTTCDTTCTAS